MNTKVVAAVAVVLAGLVLLGGAYWWMKRIPTAPSPTTSAPVQNMTTQEISGTLKSLLTSGQSVKCTFTSNSPDSVTTGNVYASGGKMRTDFQASTKAATVSGHMIVDPQFAYFWSDLAKQGIKFSTATTESNQTKAQTPNQGLDLNQDANLTCQGWSPDNSLFTLPADITFSEFSLPNVNSSGSGQMSPASYCAACNSIPAGPGRTACLSQYNCQ